MMASGIIYVEEGGYVTETNREISFMKTSCYNIFAFFLYVTELGISVWFLVTELVDVSAIMRNISTSLGLKIVRFKYREKNFKFHKYHFLRGLRLAPGWFFMTQIKLPSKDFRYKRCSDSIHHLIIIIKYIYIYIYTTDYAINLFYASRIPSINCYTAIFLVLFFQF